MRYFIEATDTGFRFGIESKREGKYTDFVSYNEDGGHGPVEDIYGIAERLFNSLRTREVKEGRGAVARGSFTGPLSADSVHKNMKVVDVNEVNRGVARIKSVYDLPRDSAVAPGETRVTLRYEHEDREVRNIKPEYLRLPLPTEVER